MPNFTNLPAFTEDGDVRVVVETPRGSRAKFAYDPKLETFAPHQVSLDRTDLSARLGLCSFDEGR
jgi:hypothetical protein